MTKEDILHHFQDINFRYNDCMMYDDLSRMLDELIAENKGEWIPVTERLPEIHQYVLLSLRSLDVEVGFRAETEPYFYCHGADGCYVEPQNVLAWQPLPEPYKAEKHETCKGCLEPCIMYEPDMRACKHKVTEKGGE